MRLVRCDGVFACSEQPSNYINYYRACFALWRLYRGPGILGFLQSYRSIDVGRFIAKLAVEITRARYMHSGSKSRELYLFVGAGDAIDSWTWSPSAGVRTNRYWTNIYCHARHRTYLP